MPPPLQLRRRAIGRFRFLQMPAFKGFQVPGRGEVEKRTRKIHERAGGFRREVLELGRLQ